MIHCLRKSVLLQGDDGTVLGQTTHNNWWTREKNGWSW